jgi:hypothetical protein
LNIHLHCRKNQGQTLALAEHSCKIRPPSR